MLIVGLTGGIGSGKTTVSDLFKDQGIAIIDTDVIAHNLVTDNESVLKEIVSLFGDGILNQDKTLNRKKLAKIVFSQKEHKQQLESILHPKIRDEVKQQIQNYRLDSTPPKYVIVVIPLLLETGFNDLIDRVLVVLADEAVRIERIRQRDHRSFDEIRAIINSQVSDEKRRTEADDIITNDHGLAELEQQIRHLDKIYSKTAAGKG